MSYRERSLCSTLRPIALHPSFQFCHSRILDWGISWRADANGGVPVFGEMLFLSTGFFLKDESSRAGKLVDEFESALCAQYTDRGCQRVGGGGRTRHDARLNSIGQTEAGVGIDDVRITHAPNLNKLFGVAGSRN